MRGVFAAVPLVSYNYWPSTPLPVMHQIDSDWSKSGRSWCTLKATRITHRVGSPRSNAAMRETYSITSSASNCIELETVRPSALAVLRLMTNSNFSAPGPVDQQLSRP